MMEGANEFCRLFPEKEQIGRLYLLPGKHARGKTFRLYVLPGGETARSMGPNPPLNENTVEVYGVVAGNPGWTESYGWLHEGKWQKDFELICEDRKRYLADQKIKLMTHAEKVEKARQEKIKSLLADY